MELCDMDSRSGVGRLLVGGSLLIGVEGWGLGCVFFFQAEDGIRDLVRSRGLGDVYKRQVRNSSGNCTECPDCPFADNR